MKPKTEMLVASAFSLAVGLSAGAYSLWPAEPSQSQPAFATHADLSACSVSIPDSTGPVPHGHVRYYDFTTDLFTDAGRLESWQKHLTRFASKPVNYLEVGVFEGRSMV